MRTFKFPLDTAGRPAIPSRPSVHRVISLLHTAVRQLPHQEHPAQCPLLEAASLLSDLIARQAAVEAAYRKGQLPSWQVRKICNYVDSHIAGPLPIADLSALIQRSEAHFSRSFRRTVGEPPHAFVIRRRVGLAAQYMLQTDARLSDIALRCGFSDQAHLCRHFRKVTGQTPAAWRRARGMREQGGNAVPASSESVLAA